METKLLDPSHLYPEVVRKQRIRSTIAKGSLILKSSYEGVNHNTIEAFDHITLN